MFIGFDFPKSGTHMGDRPLLLPPQLPLLLPLLLKIQLALLLTLQSEHNTRVLTVGHRFN